MNLRLKYGVLIVGIIGLLSGCKENPQYQDLKHISHGNLQKVDWSELKEFENDDNEKALAIFQKGCKNPQPLFISSCNIAKDAKNGKLFFVENFELYKLYDDSHSNKGLITGYYEPLLYGSRVKTDTFRYPIYKTPNDLVTIDLSLFYPELKGKKSKGKLFGSTLIPYDTREDIEKRDDLEAICYVDDKLKLFFLHIQGSGRVQLDGGEIINISYANQNGRKYVSIGKKMISDGYLTKEEVSLESIQRWLNENQSKMDEILNTNESYIFFEESNQSATGSLGVELVEGRNIAVDKTIIPLGSPVFLKTTNPLSNEKINRLVVAADTGGAIKGEVRADYFCGFGEDAGKLAGAMKQEGELYLLLPKESNTKSNKKQ